MARRYSFNNAFHRRDYALLLPAAIVWITIVSNVSNCLRFNNDVATWIGGVVAIAMWSGILSLAVLYSRWAIYAVPGFFLAGCIGSMAEWTVGGEPLRVQELIVLACMCVLSVVLIARHVKAERDKSKKASST